MADETATTTLELSASEMETVVEALRMLLATLGREDADQIHEIQALLARLAAA
ncbi:MAG: hypothetical protein MUE82_08795 [Chloroflexi bacterium]|jgi:hypothetical protein|nr:hypothetical protein [Chloroflexota bacterium]